MQMLGNPLVKTSVNEQDPPTTGYEAHVRVPAGGNRDEPRLSGSHIETAPPQWNGLSGRAMVWGRK